MTLGSLVLRSIVGPLFVGHGTQKLFGWFGGHGLDGTGGAFESMGLRPGRRHAAAAGIAEAAGGALLALGALTPLASAMISGTMITAIRTAHGTSGPWVTEGGWEYNATVLGAVFALTDWGPGRASVDDALFPRMHGPAWAIAQLAAAGAGSYLLTARATEPAPQSAETVATAPADAAVAGDRFERTGTAASS